MHATGKSVNHVPRLIIRATSCTLRGNHELRTAVESFVQQVARYGEIGELRTAVESFVQQVARYEGIVNYASGFIIRATSCTLRGNRESRIGVDSFVQQVARYEEIVNYVSGLIHSCIVACNLLHEVVNTRKD